MEQHEITQAGPLLDDQGNLREAGYARRMLPVYDRNDVKGHAMRIKEWDYYLVMNGQFALALTIADNRVYAKLYKAVCSEPQNLVIITRSIEFSNVMDKRWGIYGKQIGIAYFQ